MDCVALDDLRSFGLAFLLLRHRLDRKGIRTPFVPQGISRSLVLCFWALDEIWRSTLRSSCVHPLVVSFPLAGFPQILEESRNPVRVEYCSLASFSRKKRPRSGRSALSFTFS